MSYRKDNVWPVLKAVDLPEGAKYNYGLWFIESDIIGSTDPAQDQDKVSKSSKIKSWLKQSIPNATYGSSGELLVVPISMSGDDYESYFATDEESGEYLPTVKEPPGGRVSWLKQRYDEQQPKARRIREVSGMATKASAVSAAGGLAASIARS